MTALIVTKRAAMATASEGRAIGRGRSIDRRILS